MTNSTKAFYDMSISSLAFACKNKAQYTGLYTCIILMPAWNPIAHIKSTISGIPLFIIEVPEF